MLITLVAITALMFPVMIYAVPRAHRWYHVRMITSPDVKLRERGLNYVIRHLNDPRVLELTVARLPAAHEDNFLQIASALANTGAWTPQHIGADSYLRWLGILTVNDNPEARIFVARCLVDWPESGAITKARSLVDQLLADEVANVRYNALNALVVTSRFANNAEVVRSLLMIAARDPDAIISRHAWIHLGLLKPKAKFPLYDWRTMPPEVAEAMLWAATQLDSPPAVGFVLEALQSPEASPKVRAAAVYALNRQTGDEVRLPLIEGLRRDLHRITPASAQIVWRTMLTLPLHLIPSKTDSVAGSDRSPVIDPPFADLLRDLKQRGPAQPATVPVLPLLCAAAYADPFMQWMHAMDREQIALLHLAKFEGLAQFGSRWPVSLPDIPLQNPSAPEANGHDEESPAIDPRDNGAGPMIKLAYFSVADQVNLDMLRELLGSEEPTMRDLACVEAAKRLSRDKLNKLIPSLLTDYNDNLKIAGAMLAGLTGLQRELLRARATQQTQWSVTMMMRLGLWMQCDPEQENLTGLAPSLLSRTDLPQSSVLLALLHRGHPAAFDFLLNPTGELHVDLIQLFKHFRWWRVFSRYLPPSAPPFWVWADEDLQKFQIDVLRDWYLLNRHRLRQPAAKLASDEPRP